MKIYSVRVILLLFTLLTTALSNGLAQDQINFVAYGPEALIVEGDDDFLQIFFIAVDAKSVSNLSLQLFDPECEGEFDTKYGEYNSQFSFRLFGGRRVFSDPRIKTTHPESYVIDEGTLLSELTTGSEKSTDGRWITMKEFTPAEGERIDDKYYFKLVVEGMEGNDANVFNVRVVSSDNNDSVMIFNYCPTVRIVERSKPIQMRFVAPADEPVSFHNFDADGKALYVITPFRSDMMLTSSGEGNWRANGVKFLDIEKENICALQFGPGGSVVNDAAFYIKADENIVPFILPFEFRKSNNRPVISYDIDYSNVCNEVLLSAYAQDKDGDLVNFKWIFDDGKTASGDKITKLFPSNGTYGATVIGYDNSGAVANGSYKKIRIIINEPPAAIAGNGFIAIPNRPVSFDGSRSFDSDGTIKSYEWNFGDGTKGKGRIVNHTFTNPGHYAVILKVIDNSPAKCNYDKDTLNIWINEQPVASAGEDIAVSIGEEFKLNANASYDNDGEIVKYIWDFNDGNKADGQIVSHLYTKPGRYVAKLRIADDANVSNSMASDKIIINVNNSPMANAGKDILVALNEAVNFNAGNSRDFDGSIIKYEWDLGDGSIIERKELKHAYTKPGKYIAKLTVTDNSGTSSNTGSDERIITVNAAPKADAGEDIYQTKTTVLFNAGKSIDSDGEVLLYQWDFGDRNFANGIDVSHTYIRHGNYEAILKVMDNTTVSNNTDYDTLSVTINAKPIADAGPDIIAAPGEKIILSGVNSIDPDGKIEAFSWVMNGDEIGRGASIDHSFGNPGKYNVKLIVTDDSGHPEAYGSDEATITINAQPVIVIDSLLKVAPNQIFTLDASKSYDIDDKNLNYEWLIDDEIVSAENVYSRSFASPGKQIVLLKVNDHKGASNSVNRKMITIAVNHPPVPKTKETIFSCSRIIELDASDSYDQDGNKLLYEWNVGKDKYLTGKKVKYNFKKSGVFPVALKVDDAMGVSNSVQVSHLKVVINTAPIADAGEDITACSGDVINLSGSASKDADNDLLKYSWDFGDGTTDEGLSVTKIYNEAGIYVATLKVTDNSGLECNEDIDTKVITIIESPVAFAGPDLIACTNSEVKFDASNSTDSDGIVNSFTWDFGDGSTGGGEKTTHIYKEPGEYKVQLSITGELTGECDNTDTDELVVTVTDAPFAMFGAKDSIALGSPVTFDASLSKGNNGNIKHFYWDFGDGNTATRVKTDHEYKKAGIYTTTLRIETETDSQCKTASYKKAVYVNAQPAAVAKAIYNAIVGESIVLDASGSKDSDGQITKYVWDLGNGVIKEGVKARHTFLEAGIKKISLTVFDNTGLSNNNHSVAITADVREAH